MYKNVDPFNYGFTYSGPRLLCLIGGSYISVTLAIKQQRSQDEATESKISSLHCRSTGINLHVGRS